MIAIVSQAMAGWLVATSLGIAAHEQTELAVVLNTGEDTAEMRAELLGPLTRHTDLRPRDVPLEPIRICQGKLSCIVLHVRSDYRPGVEPYDRHRRRLGAENEPYPRYLLIMSTLEQRDETRRLSALFIDTDQALRCFDQRRSDPELELCVSDSVRVRLDPTKVADSAETRQYFRRLVSEHLKPELVRTDHWEPFARVELTSDVDGAVIAVNGRPVGSTTAGTQLIRVSAPGTHELTVTSQSTVLARLRFTVKRGDRLRATAFDAQATAPYAREALGYSGLGVAALGTALTIWSVVYGTSNSDVQAFCDPACDGPTFWTLEQMFSGRPPIGDAYPNSGSIRALPLGYSLVITGATWSLSAFLLGEENDPPWLELAAGIVLGTLAYSVSALAD